MKEHKNRIGKVVVKCDYCGEWYDYQEGKFPEKCPKCKMPVIAMTCVRCGHHWYLRKRAMPGTCPKCCSPYFNRERLNEQGKTDGEKLQNNGI